MSEVVAVVRQIGANRAIAYCCLTTDNLISIKYCKRAMRHSDIGVTMNTYTHLGLEDAKDEMIRMEELNKAKKEPEKTTDEKPVTRKMLRAV